MKKFVLIDGNALVHRAFHALPALTTARGVVTNAVYGFTSILLRIIKDLKPDYIAATFDLAGPTFRHEQYDEYKAGRVKAPDELYKQIPIVKDVLKTFGIPVYEMQGYEADDLIGTLATMAKKHKLDGDLQTIIATGDLDTLQLVDGKKVVVFTLRKGMTDTVIYDEDAVMARYGLKPEQLNDYRGLKGDPSDNIPGVPGIGEKTASDLIKKFGSLDGLYEKIEKDEDVSEKLKEKLLTNKEQAYFSKQLSEVITDLDVDFTLAKADWRANLKLSEVETAFKDLSFFSLLKRLPEIGLTAQGGLGLDMPAPEKPKKIEVETDDKNIFVLNDNKKLTQEALSNPLHTVIGHDLKNILKPFITSGVEVRCKLFDTKIAAYLLNPDLREYEFHKLYYAEFHEEANDPEQKAAYVLRLKKELWDKIKSARLEEVFEKIEMPLVPILAEMELNGIKIDTGSIAKLQESTLKELQKLEDEIYKLAGSNFNISSPQQLAEVLYNKLAVVPKSGRMKRTGGGKLSTAAPELEKLRDSHPIIEKILQYRELSKLQSTYIEPFPRLIDTNDGRIHTTYNQCGTTTGRLASEEPNLQNIPVRTELGQEFRKAFVAEEGCQLVSFDYSQLELRVVAHIAKDETMIDAFKRGEDIHTRTAAEIFDVAPYHVTKDMRRQAKVLNFGIIYGMGPTAFARSAGVSMAEAKDFIARYFREFHGVDRYMEGIKEQAHKQGYVETIFGRRRRLLDIHSTMPMIQAGAERAAINHPVQGTAADLMKLAMIKAHDFVHKNYTQKDIRILLQVHDELVCEVKSSLVSKISKEVREIMESVSAGVHALAVPLVVDVKKGKNWQETETVESS